MEAEEALEIARKYVEGLNWGYDIIEPAGVRDGYRYFHFFKDSLRGHKIGMPRIIKINNKGVVKEVEDYSEILWAFHQFVLSKRT